MPINHSVSIGWIGLGKLGLAMAGRLAAAGFSVAGYDRDQSRIALARERGLVSAANPKAAVENKDVVFASLPDDKVLRMAVLGETGLLAMMRRGSILVETSTVGAEVSAEVAQESGARSIAYLRLPVSGNPTLAETGTLTCFASGPRSALDAVQPLLATFTRAQTYLGGAEEARYAKLAINLMIAVSAGMIAETLALARKGNIAWRDILDVLAESAIASPMVKYKIGPLAERDFSSTFSCRQMAKDLDLILRAANQQNVPVPLAALMRETYSSLIAQGDGDDDFIATVRHIERLSGLAEP